MLRFDREVLLITGGAGGIGSAAAHYFLERGARVAIADTDATKLEQVRRDLRAYGDRLFGIEVTVAHPDGANRIVHAAVSKFRTLSVLINNAAVVRDNLALRMPAEQFDEVIATNLSGAFYCAKAAVPHMIRGGGGRVINMISASAIAGNPGQSNYAAAKGGLLAMTLTWSKEWAKYGITVNAVIPAAWTGMSEQIPERVLLGVFGEDKVREMRSRKPSQVAPLLGYLVSPAARDVTGQCLSIAGCRLSVWGYGKPVLEMESRDERWDEEEIAERIEAMGPPWQHPGPSVL
jgi:Dehydrogenases with different specificities (related to short-chain alcohol dehydrogenases)